MIWHIFKKDARLLWPHSVILTLLYVVYTYLWTGIGDFGPPPQLVVPTETLWAISMFGLFVLVVQVVQEDAIPGVTQDWLVRPIRRSDLLFAKLLFIALLVLAPLYTVDCVQGLIRGLTIATSASAAWWNVAWKMFFIALPAVMLAAVTRNLVELVIRAIVIYFVLGVLMIFTSASRGQPPDISSSGLAWLRFAWLAVLSLVTAVIVLRRQYFDRATFGSQVIVGAAAVVLAVTWMAIPWQPAFALQQRLSAQPGLGKAIAVGFDSAAGRKPSAAGAIDSGLAKSGTTSIFLPVRISGLDPDALLYLDRSEVRVVSESGALLYHGTSHILFDPILRRTYDSRLTVHQEGEDAAPVSAYQTIFMPAKEYAAFKQLQVRLEIDYSLTLLKRDLQESMQALNGELRTPRGVFCQSRIDSDEHEILLNCVTPTRRPSCASVTLVHPPSGMQNPTIDACRANYAPFVLEPTVDIFERSGATIPFLDPTGAIHYPVDGGKLDESRLVIQTFEAQDHFTTRLVIPSIRLSDWEASPGSLHAAR